VFFPIPCALAILQGVFRIHHIDAIFVIALFLICGIGADCLFIVFELYKQAGFIYPRSNKRRLAYAAQRGLIALATSISAAAVSFLALLLSGVRIMNHFGIFSFLLLLFTFFFTFTWYLAIIAIWSPRWEAKETDIDDLETLTGTSSQSLLGSSTETSSATSSSGDIPTPDYPYKSCLDCFRKAPVFRVDAAMIDVSNYNVWARFFYNYVTPVLYHYRLIIVVVFGVWAVGFGVLACRMGTKSELQFMSPDSVYQRAYVLALNGFATALNDFSYVYVWGIKPKPNVKFSERFTVDSYGSAEYSPIDVSDPRMQEHINWTWNYILQQDFIDRNTTAIFGVNPWDMWQSLFPPANGSLPALIIDTVLWYLNMSLLPDHFPINASQYAELNFLWQAVLSELLYQEPDSYVPGTLKANTVGFSYDDYSLRFIGMKANMFIPATLDVGSMRELYAKAKDLEEDIQSDARERKLEGLEGWFTGVAWLTMVTEEKLPQQVVKDVGVAFVCAAVVIFMGTMSLLYTLYVLISMTSTIFLTLGILYLTGWKIGCNEAIMISISSGFCADFIIQPMLAMSRDYSGRSLYGKIQASLVTFCTPVGSALLTTLVAAAFLFPCEILLFPPFATFLLGSGLFGIIHGFVVVPAWVGLINWNKRSAVPFMVEDKKQKYVEPGREQLILPVGARDEEYDEA
jgi:hypothetical protein